MRDPSAARLGRGASVAIATLLALVVGAGVVLLIPNPLGIKALGYLKAQGYLPYTPDEATRLAYERCGGCHPVDKVVKYCARCGPPFLIVANYMGKYIDVANRQGANIPRFTNAELVAIVQVWNGLVGNWEANWRPEDLKKLLAINPAMIALLETPPEERPIEKALKGKTAPGSYRHDQTGGIDPAKP